MNVLWFKCRQVVTEYRRPVITHHNMVKVSQGCSALIEMSRYIERYHLIALAKTCIFPVQGKDSGYTGIKSGQESQSLLGM
jgi:hypothetical protein